MTEKTIEYGGVHYVVRRLRNIDKVTINQYNAAIATFYQQMAIELALPLGNVAISLLEFAKLSGLVTGGTVLITPIDTFAEIESKCKEWLINDNLTELEGFLSDAAKSINTRQPDPALAPDPLPDNADPKALIGGRRSKKKPAPSG